MTGKAGALSEKPTALPARYRPRFAWKLDRRCVAVREVASEASIGATCRPLSSRRSYATTRDRSRYGRRCHAKPAIANGWTPRLANGLATWWPRPGHGAAAGAYQIRVLE
ncbi:MAG: hypothetical protein ACRD3Q_13580 [Terriglobales bacterium]